MLYLMPLEFVYRGRDGQESLFSDSKHQVIHLQRKASYTSSLRPHMHQYLKASCTKGLIH